MKYKTGGEEGLGSDVEFQRYGLCYSAPVPVLCRTEADAPLIPNQT